MPGERVETFHIKNIEPKCCLGYQNVLIHCGINDIRDKSPGREDNDPAPTDMAAHLALLAEKVDSIKTLCPYASIFVSPVLPTKSRNLSRRAIEFNRQLMSLIDDNRLAWEGVRYLNLQAFATDKDTLREELGAWDRNDDCYSKKDMIHLGRKGISLLAKTIKDGITRKFVTRKTYSNVLSQDLQSPLSR